MKKILPFVTAVFFMTSALPCFALDLCCEGDEDVCLCVPCVFCTPVIFTEKRAEIFMPLTKVFKFSIEDHTAIFSDFSADILRPPCF
jgi:hypothetical protein